MSLPGIRFDIIVIAVVCGLSVNIVGKPCEFSSELSRWAWHHHYDPTDGAAWVMIFQSDSNMRLQKTGENPVNEEWTCEAVKNGKFKMQVYVQTKNDRFCLKINQIKEVMLLTKTPQDDINDCGNDNATSSTFTVMIKRPLLPCKSSKIEQNSWIYKYETVMTKKQPDAEKECSSWAAGNLAWFDNSKEFDYIQSVIGPLAYQTGTPAKWFGTTTWLLGYKKNGQSYLTMDGNSTSYFNWADRQPGVQACVVSGAVKSYKWSTARCDKLWPYICRARCYDKDIFTFASSVWPFNKDGSYMVSYTIKEENVCKGDWSSRATLTRSTLVVRTCSTRAGYPFPALTTFQLVSAFGGFNLDTRDNGGVVILSTRDNEDKTYKFYCARWTIKGFLFLSIDVTDHVQAQCKPNQSYDSFGVIGDSTFVLLKIQLPGGKYPDETGGDDDQKSQGLSSLVIGLVCGAAGVFILIFALIMVCLYRARNRNRTDPVKPKARAPEEENEIAVNFGHFTTMSSSFPSYSSYRL